MARTRTLLQLRTEARERAGMENSTFVADTELTRYINESITELYDLLVENRGREYYMTSATITTTANQAEDDLPTDFYKMVAADFTIGSIKVNMLALPFQAERNRFQDISGWSQYYPVKYLLRADKIRWYPTPNTAHDVTLWYIPYVTDLSVDGDTFDGINGWEEYVIVDVAMKMLEKEESDVAHLLTRKAMLIDRIRTLRPRDVGQPQKIEDSRRSDVLEDY